MTPRPPQSGTSAEAENELVLSFLAVRRALGVLGLALPVALMLVALLTDEPMRPSISEFYFGQGRDLFVGILCAIGVFLWAYVGYPPAKAGEWPTDRLVSRVAAVAAIGVALVPTMDKSAAGGPFQCVTVIQCWLGADLSRILHYGAAAVFFAMLAAFCLMLFRRGAPGPQSADKIARNRIYAICGWVILGAMAAIAVYGMIYAGRDAAGQAAMDRSRAVFILESIGVFAFGISWLVKGESLKPLQRMLEPDTAPPGDAGP
ncbi:hypothetical protein [Szabonella alba]|uniref:DUF998 domain-containing protein n=1 Tax=Szabonella alba TaxID=2804194 RepID=A0A8K0VCA3_9RHOB|nr:hypothetical protein [Szabonella alba]MBL4916525.1 hypothetical protein [Szabonella alba]